VRIVRRAADVDEGFSAIKRQKAEMLVFLTEGFEEKIKRGRTAEVKVWVNSANMLTYGAAFGAVSNVVGTLNAEIGAKAFFGKGMGTVYARRRVAPLIRDDRFLFNPSIVYGDFLVTGIFIIVIQQTMLIGLALSLGLRREQGLFDAGVRWPFTYIEGKVLAQMVFYLIGIAFIVFAVFPVFDWTLQSPATLLVLFAAFMIAMAPAAVLLAGFSTDKFVAFQLLMFFSVPVYLISGFTWPLDQMPAWVQGIAALFPATPALHAMRVVTWKSGDLASIVPDLWTLAIQFAVYTAVAVVVVRLVRLVATLPRDAK
jgi:ABC-2 type transport system permease protein